VTALPSCFFLSLTLSLTTRVFGEAADSFSARPVFQVLDFQGNIRDVWGNK